MKPLAYLAGASALALCPVPLLAQDHDHHVHSDRDKSPAQPPKEGPPAAGHERHGQSSPPSTRPVVGSGTALLPANEGGQHGWHTDLGGGWHAMAHGYLWAVHTNQSGPRGDDKSYVQSMAMLSAERSTDWGQVQVKSMLSLEPLMTNRGYPNLFATAETADGAPLVDRQHPHDLFMELAVRLDINVGDDSRLILYGGPVGEPALGPSAFMHRASARYNPEAPITHHWFDSTHISYGVATLGFASQRFQLETSLFTGREPDERRWNIEKPRLDSWALRASWSPTPAWSAQISHGFIKQPEFLIHPDENEHRTTASLGYADGKGLAVTAAFSSKNRDPGPTLTAWLLEANWDVDDQHSLFARLENVRNNELFPDHDDPLHDVPFRVSKFQAG